VFDVDETRPYQAQPEPARASEERAREGSMYCSSWQYQALSSLQFCSLQVVLRQMSDVDTTIKHTEPVASACLEILLGFHNLLCVTSVVASCIAQQGATRSHPHQHMYKHSLSIMPTGRKGSHCCQQHQWGFQLSILKGSLPAARRM
jgi:hypothetical protein